MSRPQSVVTSRTELVTSVLSTITPNPGGISMIWEWAKDVLVEVASLVAVWALVIVVFIPFVDD